MDALELAIWCFLTLICIKLNDKSIYEHLQDLNVKLNKFAEIDEDINEYVDLEENDGKMLNYTM